MMSSAASATAAADGGLDAENISERPVCLM
jgi:hypothetical protein